MKFIEYVLPVNIVGAIVIACVIVAVVTGVGLAYVEKRNYSDVTRALFGIPMVLSLAVAIITPMVAGSVTNQIRRAAIVTQLNTTYELGLSYDQVIDLGYPGYKPERDFEVFGKTTVNARTSDGFVLKDVYLVWEDNHLVLAESDNGKQFNVIQKEK